MRAVCVLLSAVIAAPLAAQDDSRESAGAGLILEEIIVTATRRERSLMEVPLAVSAYGAEQLELSGVTDIGQLMRIAPSLHLSVGQGETVGATARIRGIGTTADTPGFESAVGLYVDGVLPQPGPASGSTSWARWNGSKSCVVRRAHCSAAIHRRAW